MVAYNLEIDLTKAPDSKIRKYLKEIGAILNRRPDYNNKRMTHRTLKYWRVSENLVKKVDTALVVAILGGHLTRKPFNHGGEQRRPAWRLPSIVLRVPLSFKQRPSQ